VVALLVPHRDRLRRRHDLAVAQGQPVGRVVQERMPAPLRLQQHRERGIAGDLDALDRIHLDRDGKAHGEVSLRRWLSGARTGMATAFDHTGLRALRDGPFSPGSGVNRNGELGVRLC
jgi:hypothetical protein